MMFDLLHDEAESLGGAANCQVQICASGVLRQLLEFSCASVFFFFVLYHKSNFSFLLLCFVTWRLQWLHDCCGLAHSLCEEPPALVLHCPSGFLHTPCPDGRLCGADEMLVCLLNAAQGL